jgi:tetratricopeptide (TPR) repeat protein
MNLSTVKWTALLDRIDSALTANPRWLIGLVAASLALKLMYVSQSANALRVTVPIMDSEYYYKMAVEVSRGQFVRNDAFFMGPLYPYVLAAIFRLFGESIMAARIVQAIGGSLVVLLTYLVGKRVFRPSVALVGSIMLALYGTITFYEGQLLMEWLGTLLNMSALYVLHRWSDRPGLGKYVLVGFLIGLSALARANVLVFAAVVALWILFVQRDRRRWAAVGALAASVTVAILPATIHNYVASRDFVPITSNGGVNFYVGNSDEATGIFYPPKGINLVTDDAVEKYVERLLGRELKPSELSNYWYVEALDFILSHPDRELRLTLKKAAMYLNGYEVPQIESYDAARAAHSTLRMLFVNFWMLVTLGLFGVLYLLKDWRKYFLLMGYVLSLSLSIIVFFVTARYRTQITPVLALFAAHALIIVAPAVVLDLRHSVKPLVLFILLMVSTHPRIFALPAKEVEWRELTHEARRWSMLRDPQKAIETIDRAIEIHPDYLDSYIQRAVIYKESGNLFKAISDYAKVLDINPNLSSVQYDLGQALRQLRMFEPAIEAYKKAIELSPTMLEAHNNLGITYGELKRYGEAIRCYEAVLKANPKHTKAYNNLGATYAEMGEVEKAIDVFRRAIEVDPKYANSYKNLARAYLDTSQLPQAHAAIRKYLVLVPDDKAALDLRNALDSALKGDTLRSE